MSDVEKQLYESCKAVHKARIAGLGKSIYHHFALLCKVNDELVDSAIAAYESQLASDAEPITEEWLREIGSEKDEWKYWWVLGKLHLFAEGGLCMVYVGFGKRSTLIASCTTRGELRRIVEAIGGE